MKVEIQTNEDRVVIDNAGDAFLDAPSGRLFVTNSEGKTVFCVNSGCWVYYGVREELSVELEDAKPGY